MNKTFTIHSAGVDLPILCCSADEQAGHSAEQDAKNLLAWLYTAGHIDLHDELAKRLGISSGQLTTATRQAYKELTK